MEILQQHPSEVSLLYEPGQLTLHERTSLKWLVKIIGFWILVGSTLFYILSINHILVWVRIVLAMMPLMAIVMTLVSWVMTQKYVFDIAADTVTCVRTGLLGAASIQIYALSEIEQVNLVPKTQHNPWSYYIALRLKSEDVVDIDLTTSATLDRVVAQKITQFLKLPIHDVLKQPSTID
jgi:hypothetical protein